MATQTTDIYTNLRFNMTWNHRPQIPTCPENEQFCILNSPLLLRVWVIVCLGSTVTG